MPARKRKAANANGRPLPTDLNAALRAKRALELRIQGYEYATIADMCSYASKSAAYTAIHRELARSLKPAADELRALEAERLENLWRVAYAQAIEKGSLWAIDRCVAISQQRRKMLGLDVPPSQATEVQMVIREYPAGVSDAV